MSGIVVLGFPLVAGAGFGAAWLLPRGRALLERHPQYLYAALLLVPLAAIWADGGLAAAVLPPAGRPTWWAPAWVAVAVALGGALLAAELWGTLLLRNLRATARLAASPAMESGPADPGAAGAGVGVLPVTAAIVVLEELVWRGHLVGFLQDRWGLGAAAAVAAAGVAFGANHAWFGLRAALFKSVDGVAWGALLLASGWLGAAVASHLVFDLLVWRRLRRGGARRAGDPL